MKSNEALAAEMKKNMQEAQHNREWRNVVLDIKRELPEDIRDVEPVNVGLAPAKGFKREKMSGREREKKRCEDRKIKDPDHGLFMIADGVSTGEGATAAEMTSRFVQGRLGEALDRKLANLKKSGSASVEKINDLVAAEMQKTVHEADAAVQAIQKTKPEYRSTNTTLSAAKLVELPGGGQRLYFTNLGDSRIAIQRGERFQRVTRDDSVPQMRVEAALARKNITLEEARDLDQYLERADLSDAQKEVAKGSNAITGYIGGSEKAASLPYEPEVAEVRFYDEPSEEEFWDVNNPESGVRWIDVQPGDRILVTSDGPHDNLLDKQMSNILRRFENDDEAENAIQKSAINMMRADLERSKPDDASVVVHEVGEGRPEVVEEVGVPPEAREYTAEQAAQWPEQVGQIDREILQANRELVRLEKEGKALEVLEKEVEVNQLEQKRAGLEYWIARAEADQVKDKVPHRFEPGASVRIKRDDGSFDTRNWEIRAYDATHESYVVSLPNLPAKRVSRLQLESWQPTIDLRFDDEISLPVTGPEGRAQQQEGFKAIGYRKDGQVMFERKTADEIQRYAISKDAAERYLREEIYVGARYEQDMVAKLDEIDRLKEEGAELRRDLEEARQRAAKERAEERAT